MKHIIIMISLVFVLSCGRKGDLYTPDDKSAEHEKDQFELEQKH